MHQHLPGDHSHAPAVNRGTRVIWAIAIVGIIALFVYTQQANKRFKVEVEDGLGPTLYEVAKVVEVTELPVTEGIFTGISQDVKIELKNKEVANIEVQATTAPQKVRLGEKVVVSVTPRVDGTNMYAIVDSYRIPTLILVFMIFVGLLIVFAGWSGVASLIGLSFTMAILGAFVVPQILEGRNPLLISVIGSFIIAILSLYLSHGVTKRISIALAGTLITITLAIGLAYLFVRLAHLNGAGTEEAFFLGLSGTGGLNLQGLLLGGIVIGTLGVLDDITTSQAAVVEQLHLANPRLTVKELYQRGFAVGREHIIALVNTLALAYVGAALPLMLLFVVNSSPLWVTFNSQMVAEELVRTLVGSSALILAVPITTYLAARFFSKQA